LSDEYTDGPLSKFLPAELRVKVNLKGGGVIAADRAVLRVVRELKPDLYHRPTGQLPFFKLGVPAVATIADLNYLHLPTPLIKRLYKKLSYRHTVKVADWITCISKYTRREVIKYLRADPDRTTVIYHGANQLPAKGAKLDPAWGERFWVTFGHQSHKNAEAAVLALDRRPEDESLVVIGESAHIDEVVRPLAARYGVLFRTHFIGRVDAATLRALYERALGLLFMSKFEGFGLPVVEAMSLGCPVISSDACSLPEIVSNGGMVFAPNDVIGVAKGMERLVTQSWYRENLIQAGREQAATFSWSRAADETIQVYRHVLSTSRPPGVF
jgi:glycosyltransferase involved in cell wall biosynthesis